MGLFLMCEILLALAAVDWMLFKILT